MSTSVQPVAVSFGPPPKVSRGPMAIGAALLAVSAASIVAYSTGSRGDATLLLTYAGGMAMLLKIGRAHV
mgnify:CR=1 FL=1